MWRRLVVAVGALLLAGGSPLIWPAGPAAAQTGSFTFAAAGDFGANSNTSAVLNSLSGAGADFFLAVGDLSYSQVTPESAWCSFITSRVGSTYPFELLAGNHEDDGPDGLISNFAACLPDRLGGLSGSYAKEYYVDYPSSAPLARVIGISPNLAFPNEGTYAYTVGSSHYTWLSNAIDSARAAGIRWVIVAMHENCMNVSSMSCQIGTDLQNLLVAKKVDLVLQGHSHSYQRSKQLALGPACPAIPVESFDADCVVNDGAGGIYAKGAGTVLLIDGTGGVGLASVSTTDPEAPYFAKLMGSNSNPSFGFTKFSVSATQLSTQFVAATGGFSDAFTIAAPSGNRAPTAVSGSYATPVGTAVPVALQGTDPDDCELTFSVVSPPGHGTLSGLQDQPCTAGSPNQDSLTATYTPNADFTGTDSFAFKVNDGKADSNVATVSVTVGTPAGIAFRSAASAQNPTATTLTIGRPAGVAAGDVLVAGVGIRGVPSVTAPAGWTLIRTDVAGTYTKQALYYRVATAVEPASYTWSFSSSVPAAGGILAYQGVSGSVPVNVSAGTGQNVDTTSIVAPSVTTTVAGARVVGFFSIGGNNSITPPAGMTERAEADSSAGSNHVTWEGSDLTQTAAGATGIKTATGTNPHPNVGALVALTPG